MHIAEYSESLQPQWDQFCLEHPGAWFLHQSTWIDYLCASEGRTNLSFAVVHGKDIIGICPLIVEDGEFQAQGAPLPWPLMSNHLPIEVAMSADIALKNTIEFLARHHSVTRYRCTVSALASLAPLHALFAEQRALSFSSRVIDLTTSEEALWKDVWQKYRGPIKAQRSRDDIRKIAWLPKIHDLYNDATGGRSEENWARMSGWMRQGHGHCYAALRNHDVCAFAYFLVYKSRAYWMSGKRATGEHLTALMWTAMIDLKRRGIERLELGYQGIATDEKGIRVERFKTRFGGKDQKVFAIEQKYCL